MTKRLKIFIAHSSGFTQKAIDYSKAHPEWDFYIPLLQTKQDGTEDDILKGNLTGIKWADEVHVLWDLSSLGTIFDLGMAYALGKPIKIIDTKDHHWVKFIERKKGGYLCD